MPGKRSRIRGSPCETESRSGSVGTSRELLGEVLCPSGRVRFGPAGESGGIVVAGLPRTLRVDVWGVRSIESDLADRWRWVYLDVLPGAKSVVSEPVGRLHLERTFVVADALGSEPGCELETTWPPGEFEILRDLDDQVRVSRVRIDLGTDEAVARLRDREAADRRAGVEGKTPCPD